MISRPTFLVWDDDHKPPEGEWVPILWRGFGEGGSTPVYSIPGLVEDQADVLRARFLGWIYDLGEAQIDGRRLVDHLTLRPGFSYWWMTLLAEKCNFAKSPQIYNAVRLLALEELVGHHFADRIILASSDKNLARVFREWCSQTGRAFEWRRLGAETSPLSWIKRLYCSLPYFVQALVFLSRYLWQRWSFKQNRASPCLTVCGEVTFVDYLAHLSPSALTTGRYASNYWIGLIDALDRGAMRTNWLHHYVDHAAVATVKIAREIVACFNRNSTNIQFHAILDERLSWSTIKGALCDYAHVTSTGMRLGKVGQHFSPKNSGINFWPLFEQDWGSSIFGATAILNCLSLNLFESALISLPRQRLGVYLQENMAWEMAFIYAWKVAGHGELVGAPHSTVRYWDLRYFFDVRSYRRAGNNDLPLPDFAALNGPVSKATYRKGGFPEEKILEVEALRYLHLINSPPKSKGARKSSITPVRVLILGDYLPSVVRQQMEWLVDAACILPPDTRYIVKPHPVCPIRANEYPSLRSRLLTLR